MISVTQDKLNYANPDDEGEWKEASSDTAADYEPRPSERLPTLYLAGIALLANVYIDVFPLPAQRSAPATWPEPPDTAHIIEALVWLAANAIGLWALVAEGVLVLNNLRRPTFRRRGLIGALLGAVTLSVPLVLAAFRWFNDHFRF